MNSDAAVLAVCNVRVWLACCRVKNMNFLNLSHQRPTGVRQETSMGGSTFLIILSN